MYENKMINEEELTDVNGGAGKVYFSCPAYSMNDLTICHTKIRQGECCGTDCVWYGKGSKLPD